MENTNKISFELTDSNEKIEFYVVEQTRVNGVNYILVTDTQDDEAEAFILKETFSDIESNEAVYDIVENEVELEAISKVFSELLEDIDIEY